MAPMFRGTGFLYLVRLGLLVAFFDFFVQGAARCFLFFIGGAADIYFRRRFVGTRLFKLQYSQGTCDNFWYFIVRLVEYSNQQKSI